MGAATRLLLGEALPEYAATRIRSPHGRLAVELRKSVMHGRCVGGAEPAKSAASALTIVFAHIRNPRTWLQPPAPLLLI